MAYTRRTVEEMTEAHSDHLLNKYELSLILTILVLSPMTQWFFLPVTRVVQRETMSVR